MATRVSYTATTSNGLYTVPFSYLDKSHVKVQVNGNDVPSSAYTWETSGSIRLPATVGAAIKIFRATPSTPLTVFTAGATLTDDDLQADSNQALFRISEVEDSLNDTAVTADEVQVLIEQAGVTGTDQFIRGDLASSLATKGAALVAWSQPDATATPQLVRDDLRRVLRPEHFGALGDGVTDDAVAIQRALTAAAGRVLKFTSGKTYMVGTSLLAPSGTTIEAYGAYIKRTATGTAGRLIANNSNGTIGGYDANTTIRILGGTWDGNYPTNAGAIVLFGFAHTSRIRIHDARLLGVAANHHIEFNACADALVSGCTFEGGAEQTDDSMEAIQIDGAIDAAHFGLGPYDLTFCSNIRIVNNTFKDVGTGVGTHSSVTGKTHSHIMVIGNSFSQPYFCGVRAENWESSIIANNVFYRGFHAIRVRGDAGTECPGITISNNQIWHTGNSAYPGAAGDAHGIYLFGNVALTEGVRNFSITGNVIRELNESKSGAGIKVNYCSSGVISGNVVDDTSHASGISLFSGGGVLVHSNRVVNQGSGAFGVSVTGATAVTVTGNQLGNISVTTSDKCLVMDNNVFSTGGITTSGNTNTFVKNNLTNTTFTP